MNQEAYILLYEKTMEKRSPEGETQTIVNESLASTSLESTLQSIITNLNWSIKVGNYRFKRKFVLKGGTKEEKTQLDEGNKTAQELSGRKPAVKRTHSEESDSSKSNLLLRQSVEPKPIRSKRQKLKPQVDEAQKSKNDNANKK